MSLRIKMTLTEPNSGGLHNPQECNRDSASQELLIEEFQSMFTF
jgi:hypothetical protein